MPKSKNQWASESAVEWVSEADGLGMRNNSKNNNKHKKCSLSNIEFNSSCAFFFSLHRKTSGFFRLEIYFFFLFRLLPFFVCLACAFCVLLRCTVFRLPIESTPQPKKCDWLPRSWRSGGQRIQCTPHHTMCVCVCVLAVFVLVCQKFSEPTLVGPSKLKQKHKLPTYMLGCYLGFVYTLQRRFAALASACHATMQALWFVCAVVFGGFVHPSLHVHCAVQTFANVMHSFLRWAQVLDFFRRRQLETPFGF